ncbi:MAG: PE domain-containing protein [Pseudonocardia sp.]
MADHVGQGWYAPSEWRLAAAQAELNRPSPSAGLGNGFLVDPDRACEAVVLLDEAIRDIRDALWPLKYGQVEPPGQDPVSLNLAVQMQKLNDRAVAYFEDWARQVQDARDALQAQIDAYRQADERAAERLA